MRKIKKIVFMIIFCLICISFHNVSLAAGTWKNEGGVKLDQKTCTTHTNQKCTVYTVSKRKFNGKPKTREIHIGKNGYIGDQRMAIGYKKPDGTVVSGDEGMICLQHGKEASGNGKYSGIQYLMDIKEKKIKIIPVSQEAKNKSGGKTLEPSSMHCAKVAYILSEMSNEESTWSVREENGAQLALWRIVPDFLIELNKNTGGNKFIYGDTSSMYKTYYNKNKEAQRIWNEAGAYSSCDTSDPEAVETKIKVLEYDNDYYIMGPFKMNFPTAKTGGTKLAGFESADLKIDGKDVRSANWKLCDEKGNGIEPVSGQDFYIKVKKNKIGAKVSLKVNTKRMKVKALIYTMISGGGNQNEAIVASAQREYVEKSVTFEFETFGNLRIAKKDADSGKALKGVEFTIKNSSGQYIQALDASKKVQASATGIITNIQFTKNEKKATKFLTDDKGIIELHNIPVDTYTIKETSVGKHYAYVLNKNNISWEANGKTSTGQSVKVLIKGQLPTIANSTNTMLSDEYVTIATVKNKKQVGELNLIKVDDRNRNKILPKVEFVIRSSEFNNQYIKVKATGSNVTNNTDGWATRIVGSSRINDTKDTKNNSTLEYVEEMSKATVFVTDGNGIIDIQNLISSIDGTTMIEYKLEEIKNPNYGYLSGSSGEYVNYKVTYEGESTTSNGTVKLTTSDVISVTATNHQEYIRLAGFVWEDIVHGKDNTVNNKYDETEALVEGIQVKLYKEGTFIAETTTNSNGEYQFGAENKDYYYNTDYVKDGKETGNLRIDELSQYYVEFEYDGLKYTSVVVDKDYSSSDYKITSKAEEKHADREIVNNKFAIISHNQASNTENTGTYKLEYEFGDNVSTYKDDTYWKYIRETDNKKLHVDKVKEETYEVLASTQ